MKHSKNYGWSLTTRVHNHLAFLLAQNPCWTAWITCAGCTFRRVVWKVRGWEHSARGNTNTICSWGCFVFCTVWDVKYFVGLQGSTRYGAKEAMQTIHPSWFPIWDLSTYHALRKYCVVMSTTVLPSESDLTDIQSWGVLHRKSTRWLAGGIVTILVANQASQFSRYRTAKIRHH